MTTTKAQIDALADNVRALLDDACNHDAAAREKRREAGRLLAELRSQHPQRWRQLSGLDGRLADLLLGMASGRD